MNSTPRYQQQATSTAMNTGSARTSIVTTTETCDSDELLRRKSIPSQRKDIHITASKDRLTPWLLYSIRLAVSGSSRSCVWSWREYVTHESYIEYALTALLCLRRTDAFHFHFTITSSLQHHQPCPKVSSYVAPSRAIAIG